VQESGGDGEKAYEDVGRTRRRERQEDQPRRRVVERRARVEPQRREQLGQRQARPRQREDFVRPEGACDRQEEACRPACHEREDEEPAQRPRVAARFRRPRAEPSLHPATFGPPRRTQGRSRIRTRSVRIRYNRTNPALFEDTNFSTSIDRGNTISGGNRPFLISIRRAQHVFVRLAPAGLFRGSEFQRRSDAREVRARPARPA
jgi:hypothetical protein